MWVLLKKVRSDMRRANLLSAALTLVFAISLSSQTTAQMYPQGPYCPPESGGHPHLIQMPRSHYKAPIKDHYVEHSMSVWDDQRPIEKFLNNVAKRSWLRLEYMNWDFRRPGSHIIGAPVTGLQNFSESFDTANRRDAVEIPAGTALIPNMSTIDLQDKSGMRGTLGVALNGGTMELSVFGFEKGSDLYSETGLQDFRLAGFESLGLDVLPNYAVPLLTDGAISDVNSMNAFVFDDSISANMTTQMWGAEMTLLQEAYMPGQLVNWQWLGGFRYLSLDESFNFRGVYNNGGTAADEVTQIQSATVSNIYGPEVGGRATIAYGRVAASVTPRVMLGLNDYMARTNYIDRTGLLVQSTDSDVEFSTITQLSFTTEVAVNDYCTLFAGYDFMWLPRVTRPFSNIRYDSTPAIGGGFNPNIGQHVNKESFYANGFNFGMSFAY
jgi:hypothetical protein